MRVGAEESLRDAPPLPKEEWEPEHVVEFCAQPRWKGRGLKVALGVARFDAVGTDRDTGGIARAAGHARICANVTNLDREHPALRCMPGVIISPPPPCPSFSTAGKRAGLLKANLDILCETIA
ncbi:hypothetical protein AB0H82_35210 [Streptomyces sp. NPDC050732]|uniref:hypothetical protein n=1 Tax=Streptomyces sp. NPDC050732 TaxID=3154632 RepID=UPI00342C2169